MQADRLVASGAKTVLVATNDGCIRDCLTGSFVVSSRLLLKEVTKVRIAERRLHDCMAACHQEWDR